MNRQNKEAIVVELHDDLAHSKAAFVIGYQGLSVAQMQKLRAELRNKGGKLKVAKARLMKRAAQGLDCSENLSPFFKEQIGLVFADQEAPAIAKVLHDFSKDNAALRLISGCVDNMVLDGNSIIRIASLPSREVLLGQVCGTIQAPLTRLVTVLNVLTLRLLWTLKKVGETKQQ